MDQFPFPHPLTPPQSEEDVLAWLRLLRSRRVGISTFFRLMGEHGTAQAALAALPETARSAGVSDYQACPLPVVEAELSAARKAGATFLAYGSPAYPAQLADLPDAPPILWARGDLSLLSRPIVGLVGARNSSSLGLRMARRLATDLGQAGHVIVSGLARGIDTAVHKAALETGTIAVLASGVDVIYPAENRELGAEIERKGLLLSEAPLGTSPQARHFPARNRIVSGLSRALVVVEAAARSGSLITARAALDQGRDVLAVPGHPFDARASGCNMLIRDGAVLVRGADDVIEALAAAPQSANVAFARPSPDAQKSERVSDIPTPAETRSPAQMHALHRLILDRLGPSPIAEDELIRDLARPAKEVSAELACLELEGKIERQPGGLVHRLT